MVEYDQNIKNLTIITENNKIIYDDQAKNIVVLENNMDSYNKLIVFDVKSDSCIYGDCQNIIISLMILTVIISI